MKKVHFLNDPIKNVVIVVFLTVIAYILTLSLSLSSGHAGAIEDLFYPCLVALATLAIYLISLRYFTKYNWVISLTGISAMFYISFLLNWNLA